MTKAIINLDLPGAIVSRHQHGHFAGAARRGKRGIAAAGIFQRMGGSTEKKRNLIRDPCGFLAGVRGAEQVQASFHIPGGDKFSTG